MEDRIFSGNDITSGAGTKTVTFTSPYKTANYAVGITGQGMATGDFFLVDTKQHLGIPLQLYKLEEHTFLQWIPHTPCVIFFLNT